MVDDALEDAQALSIPEVHDLLERERANRGELSYEQKLSLEHAKAFDRLGSREKAEELRAELEELDRVTQEQAIKIVDLLPVHEAELEAVFSEDRRELTEEQADTIISIVSDYV